MAKNITFQLNTGGGANVLQEMAMGQVRKSTSAITSRANSLSNIKWSSSTSVAVNVRGLREIGVVATQTKNPEAMSILKKAIDAGRV